MSMDRPSNLQTVIHATSLAYDYFNRNKQNRSLKLYLELTPYRLEHSKEELQKYNGLK